MPRSTHKITRIRCLKPPCAGQESLMAVRCDCGEGPDCAPYSVALGWWTRHISRHLCTEPTSSDILNHATSLAFQEAK